MNAIVVAFDRLPLHLLGCYGNAWISTPNFDRLAAGAVLFEEHFAEHADRSAKRRAWKTGRYEFLGRRENQPGLLDVLEGAGVATRLLDEASSDRVTDWDLGFEDAPFAALVNHAGTAIEELRARGGAWLCWLRSRGVPLPCRPPRALVELYLDFAEDSAADSQQDAPRGREGRRSATPRGKDPDQQWREAVQEFEKALAFAPEEDQGIAQPNSGEPANAAIVGRLAAAYVSLIDLHLGRLLDAIEPIWDDDCLLIITAAAGMHAGVVRQQPHPWPQLADEVVHTPLLIRGPQTGLGSRRRALAQTVDLPPTLCEWFGVQEGRAGQEGVSLLPIVRDEVGDVRHAAYLGDGLHVAGVRTHDFYLIEPANVAEGGRARLFVKPDDAWEIHDVAPQTPGQAETLSQMLADFLERAAARQ